MGKLKIRNYLQRIFYFVLFISLLFIVIGAGSANDQNDTEQLAEILFVMDKQLIEVSEWKLYTRNHLSNWRKKDEHEAELESIKSVTKDFTWENALTTDENGQRKIIGTLQHHDLGFIETLTYIVYPHHESFNSYLIYEIQGDKKPTDNSLETLSHLINSRHEDLFTSNTKYFTCVTGNINDKLNFGLNERMELLLNEFSATITEELNEETFISISAYNNTWNNFITTNGKKMNLQVAIRDQQRLGGKTTVTIGTPIITTEY